MMAGRRNRKPASNGLLRLVRRNKVSKFLLSSSSEADFGVSGIIMILGMILSTVLLISFVGQQTNLLKAEYINVGFHNPKFFEDYRLIAGYDDTGDTTLKYSNPTSNYVTYELLRQTIFPAGAVLLFIYIMIMAWGEVTGMFGGQTKSMFLKFIGMLILVMIFVPVWDILAIETEKFSIYMLNPMWNPEGELKKHDLNEWDTTGNFLEDVSGEFAADVANLGKINDRCQEDFDEDDVLYLVDQKNREIAEKLPIQIFNGETTPCSPNLRIVYVFDKAYHGASTGSFDPGNISFEDIFSGIEAFFHKITTTVFMGMTKMMLLFMATLTALIVMTVRELFLAVTISLFPMLMLLSFIPKLGDIFGKLLSSILPLLMIPIMVGAVFFTGAGILHDMELATIERQPFNEQFGVGEKRSHIGSDLTFWLASISLLLLAVAIPTMLAPILSDVSGKATSMVTSAVNSGMQGAMSVGQGGAMGAAGGISSAGGKGGVFSKAGMRGIMSGIAGGMAGGTASGIGKDLDNQMPGGGGGMFTSNVDSGMAALRPKSGGTGGMGVSPTVGTTGATLGGITPTGATQTGTAPVNMPITTNIPQPRTGLDAMGNPPPMQLPRQEAAAGSTLMRHDPSTSSSSHLRPHNDVPSGALTNIESIAKDVQSLKGHIS